MSRLNIYWEPFISNRITLYSLYNVEEIPVIAIREFLSSFTPARKQTEITNDYWLYISKGVFGQKNSHFLGGFLRLGSGGRIRTYDLRVMSPTSYQAALPRDVRFILTQFSSIFN